jgi:acetyl-CoA acetyltransferase
MRDVVVVGVGMTEFGKHYNRTIKELGEEAIWKALKDANIDPMDIQVAYCGSTLSGITDRQAGVIGQLALKEVGITKIPVTRVENACASGSCAFHEAWICVASGMYDVAIAIGIEKMTGVDTSGVVKALADLTDVEIECDQGYTFPGHFGIVARSHMHKFGTTREQLAMVSVKNHKNGTRNPYSQFKKEISIEDVLNSYMISDPLRLLDCCSISDGAAVAIVTDKQTAKNLTDKPIYVASSVLASGSYGRPNLVSLEVTERAAKEAYEKSGLGPQDIDLAEVHDAFTINELLHYEDLGFCKKGEGGKFIEEGQADIGGKVAINPSGGLLSKGHPVGATGIAQIAELVWHLRGDAEERQVANAEIGLAHCVGGFTCGGVGACCITILKN